MPEELNNKAEKEEQQALNKQAAAQVLTLQHLDARALTPGGLDEADEVYKQSGKDELLSVAVLSVAKAHFHALKSCNAEFQEEDYNAWQVAEESNKSSTAACCRPAFLIVGLHQTKQNP